MCRGAALVRLDAAGRCVKRFDQRFHAKPTIKLHSGAAMNLPLRCAGVPILMRALKLIGQPRVLLCASRKPYHLRPLTGMHKFQVLAMNVDRAE